VVRGGYYASGQACISVQRVIVVDAVRNEFLDRLAARMDDVVVGDPRDPATRVSTLINPAGTDRVLAWINEAADGGAKIITGGSRTSDGVIQPTVLVDVPEGLAAWNEEIFGPVVAVRSVADLDAAFRTVNDSRYGLHVSVYTESLSAAFAAIESIEAGGVVINDVPGFRSDVMPYGGVKESGTGREGPRFAIEEFTVTRMAIIRPSAKANGSRKPS